MRRTFSLPLSVSLAALMAAQPALAQFPQADVNTTVETDPLFDPLASQPVEQNTEGQRAFNEIFGEQDPNGAPLPEGVPAPADQGLPPAESSDRPSFFGEADPTLAEPTFEQPTAEPGFADAPLPDSFDTQASEPLPFDAAPLENAPNNADIFAPVEETEPLFEAPVQEPQDTGLTEPLSNDNFVEDSQLSPEALAPDWTTPEAPAAEPVFEEQTAPDAMPMQEEAPALIEETAPMDESMPIDQAPLADPMMDATPLDTQSNAITNDAMEQPTPSMDDLQPSADAPATTDVPPSVANGLEDLLGDLPADDAAAEPAIEEPAVQEPVLEPAPETPMDAPQNDGTMEPLPWEIPAQDAPATDPMPLDEAPTAQEPAMDAEPSTGTPAPLDLDAQDPMMEPAEPAADPTVEPQTPQWDTPVETQPFENTDVTPDVSAEVAPETQALIEADPTVQQSVSVIERALTEIPLAAAGGAPVNEPAIQTITTGRTAADEYVGAVNSDANAYARQDNRDRERRRDRLEAAGLGAIAGLVVGAIINNRQEVVATTPERVVVIDRTTNNYTIWRDDDSVVRQPGLREEVTRYADGSVRTVVYRPNEVRIETIRDATGRVLRRERVWSEGRTVIIDDTRPARTVDIRALPAPRVPRIYVPVDADPALGAEIVRTSATQVDRGFSLNQIRTIPQVRALAPVLATDPVLFATGSAALTRDQAVNLSGLAAIMLELLRQNPAEMFIVEGHTDAVGSAASNLALSDRRAETVAKALVDYFGVPPENLVFQGYGESLLAVRTEQADIRNRRVELRRITPLLDPRMR